MKAYACVYRRSIPKRKDLAATERDAMADPNLRHFLREYLIPERYFDWGDDPAFFAAGEFLGDVRRASWGVCRPDVRAVLDEGDFIVFFCAKPRVETPSNIDYYYIGVGTVAQALDRKRIWTDETLRPYRQFYNVLAQFRCGNASQKETFHPYHHNWRNRLSPYIIFAASDDLTHFNLQKPLRVATYSGQVPELWGTTPTIMRLRELLFSRHNKRRGLRTSRVGFAHPKLNLGPASPGALALLRRDLIEIARSDHLEESFYHGHEYQE